MKKSALASLHNIDEAFAAPSSESSIMDYVALMKPRVMMLVVFTAICGMMAAGGSMHPLLAICSILFITLGAGSSAAINMWYDRDIDALMVRTQRRPIITGAIMPDEALSFGVITGVVSVIGMTLCVNMLSAALLALAILYYVFIYTIWLKRSSVHNVVIGGVSGALPPVIGWAAATNEISWSAIALFMLIFIWTPPHSWALALFRLQDYQNCKVPMLPAAKGTRYCRMQILIYSFLMLPAVIWPYLLQIGGLLYLTNALISTAVFITLALKLFFAQEEDALIYYAKKLFWYSIIYLFSLFLTLLV
jgi:protoheme IX farnesyltransferase